MIGTDCDRLPNHHDRFFANHTRSRSIDHFNLSMNRVLFLWTFIKSLAAYQEHWVHVMEGRLREFEAKLKSFTDESVGEKKSL